MSAWQGSASESAYSEWSDSKICILVVEDDEVDLINLNRLLALSFGEKVKVDCVGNWDEALDLLQKNEHEICIVDFHLGGRNGLELIEQAQDSDDERVFIILTGCEDPKIDAAATRAGIADYLIKDELSAKRLERSIRYAMAANLKNQELRRQAEELRATKALVEERVQEQLTLTSELRKTQQRLTKALTRAESSERRYRWLAQHDLLTGIPNRELFAEELSRLLGQAARNSNSIGLLLLDVDRFKWVNDSFGHKVGDNLLKAIAQRLQDSMRSTDFVARLGGDEFAVVVTNLNDHEAVTFAAEKLVAALSRPFELAEFQVDTGVSIGVSLSDGIETTDPDLLIQQADAALYQAKNSGRGIIHFFDDALDAMAKRTALLRREIPLGIADRQFSLHFQPKIDVKTGLLAGAEALARWHHPTLGRISPGEFIKVAEGSGQIFQLSQQLFEVACQTIAEWRGTSLANIPLALNLSPNFLKKDNFLIWLVELLERYSIDPRLIELEVTETATVDDLSLAMTQLTALRRIGVKISIDDFGTGYSSLALVTALPADALKIDLSFIAGMLENPADAAAVDTTITLAHNLGMRAVAEGVETQEQLDYLRSRNCDEAQGYFICKPITAEEFLHEWSDRSQAARMAG